MVHNSEKDYHNDSRAFVIQKVDQFFMEVYNLFWLSLNLAKWVFARYSTDFNFPVIFDKFLELRILSD